MPRLYFRIGRRLLPTWATMGGLGTVLGAALFVALTRRTGVPITAAISTVAVNVAGFFGWTAVRRSWHGEIRYVLLEHALVAAGTTVAVVTASGVAPVDLLEPWVAALALALGVGRIGCLLSGCCHGKPAARGVRYRWRLPWLLGPRWRDIRLYPLQAMEAAGLVALSAVGVAMPARAGLAAAVVAVGYAVMRFELELWRGDDRRYIGPLSHNQWSCLALVLLVALLDLRIAVVTFTVMAVLAGIQRRRFVPPAIIVTSETQMRALLAAVVAACGGQCGQVGGVLLEPDGQGGVSASGAWGLLRPSELQVVVVAAAAAHNRSAS